VLHTVSLFCAAMRYVSGCFAREGGASAPFGAATNHFDATAASEPLITQPSRSSSKRAARQ